MARKLPFREPTVSAEVGMDGDCPAGKLHLMNRARRCLPLLGTFVEIEVNGEVGGSLKLKMKGPAVATSADFSLGGAVALVDSKSRTLIRDERRVSVFAGSCMMADALTKVVFLNPNYQDLLNDCGAEALISGGKQEEWR